MSSSRPGPSGGLTGVTGVLTVLVLLSASAQALVFITETTDGKLLFTSPHHTVVINSEKNVMRINNAVEVFLFPEAKLAGGEVKGLEPSMGIPEPGSELADYIVSYPPSFARDVYVSSKVHLRDKYVQQEITIENTKTVPVEVRLSLGPVTNETVHVFSPFLHDPLAGYLWTSPPFNKEKGVGVAIYFDTEPPTYVLPVETSMEKGLTSILSWKLPVEEGETKTVTMKYVAGYVADKSLVESNPFKPDITKQYLVDTGTDPLFTLKNLESLDPWVEGVSGGTPQEVIESLTKKMNGITDTPTSETTLKVSTVNFREITSKTPLDSLEKSLIFREALRKKGIPAELHLGKSETGYYAWVNAYTKIGFTVFDPAGKKGSYREVYVEPEPVMCRGDMYSCPWITAIKTDLVCILNFCASVYIVIAFIVLFMVSLFFFLQYKAEVIYRWTSRGKRGRTPTQLEGSYSIVREDYKPVNPLEESILREIKATYGVVKVDNVAEVTGFSKLLVQTTLEGLTKKKVIKKQ